MNAPAISAPSQPPIAHRYTLTRGDLFRWQVAVVCRNRMLWGIGLFTCGLLLWDGFRDPKLADYSVAVKVVYAGFIFVVVFSVLAFVMLLTIGSSVRFKKYEGLLCEHELEIRPEGMLERTSWNESIHRWSRSQKLVTTARLLVIYVTDTNVHVVPRRSFGSPALEQSFCNELRQRMQSASAPAA